MQGQLDSILACGDKAPGKMIGNAQNGGDSVFPRHSAYALGCNIGGHANGRDKEWISGGAATNGHDSRAMASACKCGLGNTHYWRASSQGFMQMRSETGLPEGRQPYIAVNYDDIRQRREEAKHSNKAWQFPAIKTAGLVWLHRLDVLNVRRVRRFGFP